MVFNSTRDQEHLCVPTKSLQWTKKGGAKAPSVCPRAICMGATVIGVNPCSAAVSERA
jgi:hypothetical protein